MSLWKLKPNTLGTRHLFLCSSPASNLKGISLAKISSLFRNSSVQSDGGKEQGLGVRIYIVWPVESAGESCCNSLGSTDNKMKRLNYHPETLPTLKLGAGIPALTPPTQFQTNNATSQLLLNYNGRPPGSCGSNFLNESFFVNYVKST